MTDPQSGIGVTPQPESSGQPEGSTSPATASEAAAEQLSLLVASAETSTADSNPAGEALTADTATVDDDDIFTADPVTSALVPALQSVLPKALGDFIVSPLIVASIIAGTLITGGAALAPMLLVLGGGAFIMLSSEGFGPFGDQVAGFRRRLTLLRR